MFLIQINNLETNFQNRYLDQKLSVPKDQETSLVFITCEEFRIIQVIMSQKYQYSETLNNNSEECAQSYIFIIIPLKFIKIRVKKKIRWCKKFRENFLKIS